jgi:nucleoside phosphorylase
VTKHVDIVVLTVIPVELEAARSALEIDARERETSDDGTVYFRGVVRSELVRRDYEIILACIGSAGNPGAAAAAAIAITRYRPRVVLLVGIAAGMRGKTRIGDVVVSERVVAYEPAVLVRGESGQVMQSRPEIDRAPHAMTQAFITYSADANRLRNRFARTGGKFPVVQAGRDDEFRQHVARSIGARLTTIASGEKLLRDPTEFIAIRDGIHGKTEAGEMEAAGVIEADLGQRTLCEAVSQKLQGTDLFLTMQSEPDWGEPMFVAFLAGPEDILRVVADFVDAHWIIV